MIPEVVHATNPGSGHLVKTYGDHVAVNGVSFDGDDPAVLSHPAAVVLRGIRIA